MEQTLHTVKLYKGTTQNVASKYGYRGVTLYKFALQLKSLFPYSYIYHLNSHIPSIAKHLNLDRRTVKKRIQRLIELNFAYMEGNTLRLISDVYIKQSLASQNGNKYHYKWVSTDNVDKEVRLQPIAENLRRQQQAKAMKKREGSNTLAECQSSFHQVIKNAPHAKLQVVDTTLLSQAKAAKLLGYRSNTSGYRQLQKLSMAGCLEIESNKVELTREDFNRYKECHMGRLLIMGRGKVARYFYLVTNTVKIIKPKPVTEKGLPYYLNDNW